MKDFGAYLRRARRTDPHTPDHDWSAHYVDYDEMKNRMVKDYLRRRKALRSAVIAAGAGNNNNNSTNAANLELQLPHTDVQLIYQQSTLLAAKNRQRSRWTECGDLIDISTSGSYSNFDELDDNNDTTNDKDNTDNNNTNTNNQTSTSDYQIYDDNFQTDQLEDGQAVARRGPQHPNGMSHLEYVTDLSQRNVVVERADFCSLLDRENAKVHTVWANIILLYCLILCLHLHTLFLDSQHRHLPLSSY
jgi:hypothetical protein